MAAISNNLGDYLDDLNSSANAADCMATTHRHVMALGFRNVVFTYAKRPRNIEGDLDNTLRYSSIPKAWETRYHEMGYQNHCPILRESLRGGSLPLIWQQIWDQTERTATQETMVDEAAELGVVDGVSVPIKMPNGDFSAGGISTDEEKTESKKIIGAQLPLIFAMSHYLHAVIALHYLTQTGEEDIPRLTGSEIDCLYWVALGKSTWEISEIHDISENTVKFHLRNILSKLAVNNRPAAVAKAFRLGLIDF